MAGGKERNREITGIIRFILSYTCCIVIAWYITQRFVSLPTEPSKTTTHTCNEVNMIYNIPSVAYRPNDKIAFSAMLQQHRICLV